MKILLLQNDPLSALTKQALESGVEGVGVQVVETEYAFRCLINSQENDYLCSLVISEAEFPWAIRGLKAQKAPASVQEEKECLSRVAGARCWAQFRLKNRYSTIPWIYYTLMKPKHIRFREFSDEDTYFVKKNENIAPLLRTVKDALKKI